MKQFGLFGEEISSDDDKKYTKKIQSPIYEPKNKKPHPVELYDNTKTIRLIKKIECSNLDDFTKKFLIEAARRHTKFNYSLIADFYAHSDKEVQELMEHSALVIIDFEKSLQYGYTKLSDEMMDIYLNEPEDE